jgi:4-oxalocrotonate tautomerase family enzyme
MPHISVHILKQPDVNKKRKLVEKLTDSVAEVYGVPKEAISIELWENEPENMAHGGQLLLDTKL